MRKSNKVTFDQVCKAYTLVINAKEFKRRSEQTCKERKSEFDKLVKKASKEVLAKFTRESNIFNG